MNEGCSNPKYNLLKSLNKYEYKGKFRLATSRECYLSSKWVLIINIYLNVRIGYSFKIR